MNENFNWPLFTPAFLSPKIAGKNFFNHSTCEPRFHGFETPSSWFQYEVEGILKRYRRRNRSGARNFDLMDDLNQYTGEDHLAFIEVLRGLNAFPTVVRTNHDWIDDLAKYAHSTHAAFSFLLTQPGIQEIPEDVRYVSTGLISRAVSSFLEIHILLLNGYSAAARSRWRTLYEITVVARVIAGGPKNTALRFREYRWIDICRERTASAVFDWEGGPTPEQMKTRLTRRFGKEFAQPYGWAAVIAKRRLKKGRKLQVRFSDLIELAGMEAFKLQYQRSHHDVHGGDSFGLLANIEAPDDPFFASATLRRIRTTALDATKMFAYAVDATLGMLAPWTSDKSLDAVVTYVKILETDYMESALREHLRYDQRASYEWNAFIDSLLKGEAPEIAEQRDLPHFLT